MILRSLLLILLSVHLTTCQTTPLPATATPVAAIQTPLLSPTSTPSPAVTLSPLPLVTPSPPVSSPLRLTPTAPLPLSAFPRPKDDNGLGIHWSTHLYAQSDEATGYFVSELARMNIKWVKLLVDGLNNRDYDETIDELVKRE